MRRTGSWSTLLFFFASAALLAGCGGAKPPTVPVGPPRLVEIPVEVESGPPMVQVVHLTGDDTMHYNGNRITVQSGQMVRIELKNIGRMPREQMAHNFVLLKPGADLVGFNFASALAKDHDYLPPDQMESVIAFTPLVGAGKSVTVEFSAPTPGEYDFLCNFPGHFAGGMKGVLVAVPPPVSK